MNNSNAEFTMDDASYQSAMQLYSDGKGGYNIPGLQSEIPTRTNTPTFDPIYLGEWAKPYNEFGEETYTRLADEENKNIRRQNEKAITRYKALQATATPEEIAALDLLPQNDPEYKDYMTEALIKGDPDAKASLGALYKMDAERKRKQANGEAVFDNGTTLDHLENVFAMIEKQTGKSATPQDKANQARLVSQEFGVNVTYDPNTNGFYVTDKNKNTFRIQPGFGDIMGAWAADISGQILGSIVAHKYAKQVVGGAIRLGGRALGATAMTAGAATTPVGGVGIGGIAAGAGIWVGAELVANAATTYIDGLTSGAISQAAFTAPSRLYATITGDEKGENAFYTKAFDNVMSVVGYPDAAANTAQEAVLGTVFAGGINLGIKGIKQTGKGISAGVSGVKDLRSRVRDFSAGGNALDQGIVQQAKNKAEDITKTWKAKTEENALENLRAEMAQKVTDKTLSLSEALGQARNIMKTSGVDGIEVNGAFKSIDELSDADIAFWMIQTNSGLRKELTNIMGQVFPADARKQVKADISRTSKSINDQVLAVAQDGLDNATAKTMITRLKDYEQTTEKLMLNSQKAFADKFKGVEFTVRGDLAKNMSKIFDFNNNKITTFFAGKGNVAVLGEKSALKKNMNSSQNGYVIDLATGKPVDLTFNASIDDLLTMRFELMARGNSIAKNIEGKNEAVNRLCRQIDVMIKRSKKVDTKAYDDLLEQFGNTIKNVERARTSISRLKVPDDLEKGNLNKLIGEYTESILTHADDSLPDLRHFAEMLKSPKQTTDQVMGQLEHQLVNHIITKGLNTTGDSAAINTKGVLDWLSANKHNFTTQQGKIMADFAQSSIKLMDDLSSMAASISERAVKHMAPGTALSKHFTHAMRVFSNRILIGRVVHGVSLIIKTDYRQQYKLAESFSKFIANPVKIDAINGVKHNLARAASKGEMDEATIKELAKSMGEVTSLYRKFMDNPNEIVDMATLLKQQEDAAAGAAK